jgi:membrane fusion protein (multidrug efflux system)
MTRKALITALYAIVCFAACTPEEENKIEGGKFSVTNPLLTDTSYTSEYVAEIQSVQNVEIHAKVKGYIETINVDEGQHVNAGQILFTIRPNEFESELLKAKAETRSAELELQNTTTLADKNIVSPTELALAAAKLDQAKAEQDLAELELSYTRIKAPFDGTIDRLQFKAGSLIDEGTLLTTLSNNKEVYAYFNVSEAEYLDYKARKENDGKNIATLLLANNQPHKYKGTIETIEGEFDKNTGSIAFRAKFSNPELLLKHGETGRVQLINNLQNAMLIPQKATFEIQDKFYVYVVDENNVVKARNISIKQKLPNLYVVGIGLSAKDKFLLDGTQNVKEDDKIQIEFIPPRQAIEHLQLISQPGEELTQSK